MWPFKAKPSSATLAQERQRVRQEYERLTRRLLMRTTLIDAMAYLSKAHKNRTTFSHVWWPVPPLSQDVLCFATTDQIQIESTSGELLITCYLNLKSTGKPVALPSHVATLYDNDIDNETMDIMIETEIA